MAVQERFDDLFIEQEEQERKEPWRVPFKWYDVPVLGLFIALFLVVFLQFFSRYVLNDSVAWTEEMARYLLICLAFVGAVKCQLIDSHIRLDFVDKYFGRHIGKLKVFALLATTSFFGFATYSLWQLIKRTSYQKMVSLPFPKYYLYAVVLAALVVLCAVAAIQTIRALKASRS